MPRFSYSAYEKTGRLVKGAVNADSDAEALHVLADRGLTPVSVTLGDRALPWWAREISFGTSDQYAKRAELSAFFSNLSSMLNAHFPLMKALQFCLDQTQNLAMRRALLGVREDVANGGSLHEALANAQVFPPRLVSLVDLGERSNSLPEVTRRIAGILSEEMAMRRELRGALVYPVILLIMSVLVLILLIFYLVPTLTPVFRSADASLPAPLQIMSNVRAAIISGWPVILGIGAGGFALIYATWSKHAALREKLLHRFPVIGTYLRQKETLGICQTLSVMMSSGATLNQALATCGQSNLSPNYRALVKQAEEALVAGGALSDVITQSRLIDPMAAALMEAADEADGLPEVLETIVAELTVRTRRTLAQAIQLLIPVLTLLIGFTVGPVILSTISAIMDLNDIAI